jgi:hypothetical protein
MVHCPNCKSEFRDGFEFCSTCNCALVEELPDEETKDIPIELQNENEVFLINVRNEYEADIIESILSSNGIKLLRKHRDAGGYLSIYMGNSVQGVDIYVRESEYEVALEMIKTEQEAWMEMDYEVPAEEQSLLKQEEIKSNKRRSMKAWIILLFFSSGIFGLIIYLFIIMIDKIFK